MSHGRNIIFAIALLSSSAFAVDVTPTEKLGKLTVLPADAKKLDSSFDLQKLQLRFIVDSTDNAMKLGIANDVAAGQGCLQVQYQGVYVATQCGIKIEDKKLTTVQLSAIKYTWDVKALRADFGPQPVIGLSTQDANHTLDAKLNPASPSDQKVLMIPAMNVTVSLASYETGVLHQQASTLAAGDVIEEKIKTPELRGKLFLDFIHGKPTFNADIAPNFITANFRSQPLDDRHPRTPLNINSVPVGSFPYSNGGPVNYYKFATTGDSQAIYAYPLRRDLPNYYYEVSINEQVIKPVLEANKTTRIPVATLNVFHYRSDVPGVFKVYSDHSVKGTLKEQMHPSNPPHYLQETYFPTNSSLFFPIGSMFRLDFYLKDDFGRNTLQDQVTVDLTHE